MSSWLYSGLVKSGFDVVCMETFQAHRFLATYRNKTDKNDARGLAQLVRMGGEDFLRVVSIRSQASQETRVLLAMRDHLVSQKVGLENHIAGVLKPFGVIVERGNVTADTFYRRTLEGLAEAERNGVQVQILCAAFPQSLHGGGREDRTADRKNTRDRQQHRDGQALYGHSRNRAGHCAVVLCCSG